MAAGRIFFGLSDDEFWRLTPYQYAALVMQWKHKIRIESVGVANLNAALANLFRSKGRPPFSADDFLPFHKVIELSPEDAAANAEVFFGIIERRNENGR